MRYLVFLLVLFLFLQGHGKKADLKQNEVTAQAEAVEVVAREDFTQHCEYTPPHHLNELIHGASKEFDVPARAIALTVYRESGCKTSAVGSSGEIGLMQINPSVWGPSLRKRGFNIHKSKDNIRAGALILVYLRSVSSGVKETLRRYNGSGKKAELYATEQISMYHKLWNERLKIPKNTGYLL